MNNAQHHPANDPAAIRQAQYEWRIRKRRELELKAEKKANRRRSSRGTSPSTPASNQPSGALSPSVSQSDTPTERHSQGQAQSHVQTLAHTQPEVHAGPHLQSQTQLQAQTQGQIQRALQMTSASVLVPSLPASFVMSASEAINTLSTSKQQPASLVSVPGSGSLAVPTTSSSPSELAGLPATSHAHGALQVGGGAGPSSTSGQETMAAVAAAAATAAAVAVAGYVPSDSSMAELLPRPALPPCVPTADAISAEQHTQQPVEEHDNSQSHSASLNPSPKNDVAIAQRRWREEKRRELELKRTRGSGSKRGRKKQRVANISPVAALPLASQAAGATVVPAIPVQVSTHPAILSMNTSNGSTAPKTTFPISVTSPGVPGSIGTGSSTDYPVPTSNEAGSFQVSAALTALPIIAQPSPSDKTSTIQGPKEFSQGISDFAPQANSPETSKTAEIPNSEAENNMGSVSANPVAVQTSATDNDDVHTDEDAIPDDLSRATQQAAEELVETDHDLGVEERVLSDTAVDDIAITLRDVHQSDEVDIGSVDSSIDGDEPPVASTPSGSVVDSKQQEHHTEAKLSDADDNDVNTDGVNTDAVGNAEVSVEEQVKAETGESKANASDVGPFQDGSEEIMSAADPWDALDSMDNS